MQLKQVAELVGADNKEVISVIEAHREEFVNQGFKLAKKLTAASALDQTLAALIVAEFDIRRAKESAKEEEDEKRRRQEEEARRRSAEEAQRQKDEAERAAKAEEAHRRAEAELARKQAELKAAEEEAKRREAAEAEERAKAAELAEATKPAQEAKPALDPAAEKERADAERRAEMERQRQLAAVAMMEEQRRAAEKTAADQKAAEASAAPASSPAAPQAQRPTAPPSAPRAPQAPRAGQGQNFPRTGAPRGNQSSGPRAPRPSYPAGPQGPSAFDPRAYQSTQQPRNFQGDREQRGPRPPQGERGPGRPGGPRTDQGPRQPGARPVGLDSRGQRNFGDRPQTGRPGGPSEGRGPRTGAPTSRSPANRTAGQADLQSFVNQGLSTEVDSDFRKTVTRRPPLKGPKVTTPPERDAEGKIKRPGKPGDPLGGKKIRPTQVFADALGDDRRSGRGKKKSGNSRGGTPVVERPKVVHFSGDFTVGEFAERTNIGISDVMKQLMLMGDMLTINQLLDPDKAEELAMHFEIDIKIEREGDEFDLVEFSNREDAEEDLVPRAPVVTVMGHVDHGKTSLLDCIRKADVASGEYGGITQHIGAYNVSTSKGPVVFLDTPGHEAFTEMRSRGANVTDLVVLVVAANDGVMPQTVEAINHAKAAQVPIIVAINKMDVPGANPEKVKQELLKYELVPEEYGGETIMIPVSAKTKLGIEDLLEYIALQTEILELRANPARPAEGTVIESHVDPLRGAVATVLVERGTLRIGDIVICGTETGRVRAMRDDRDNLLTEAGPSTPVEILGLSGSPIAGEKMQVMPDEAKAREIAERRSARRKTRRSIAKQHISLDNLADRMSEGDSLTLNVIVKADVQGSVEAINNALLKIKSDKVTVKILHSAVGAVSVSDIQLADASDSIVLAFNVGQDPAAKSLAEEEGVDIRSYQIIYALLEDMEKAMVGLLAPEYEEKDEGRAKVQQTFKVSKVGTVAGCLVEDGVIGADHHARLLRNGTIVWRGKLKSLRRVKDDVKQVLSGVECGIGLENFNDIKEGDIIETYTMVQKAVSLVTVPSDKG